MADWLTALTWLFGFLGGIVVGVAIVGEVFHRKLVALQGECDRFHAASAAATAAIASQAHSAMVQSRRVDG